MLLAILLPLLEAYAGFQAGRWLLTAKADGDFVHWKPLADPPTRVTSLLEATPESLFVQTTDGVYFNVHVQDCLGKDSGDCWKKVPQVDTSLLIRFGCPKEEAGSRFRVPPAPLQAVESRMVHECGGEWYNETHYALGQDGRIWVWSWGSFSMGMAGALLLDAGSGVLVGFSLGVALAVIVIRRLRRAWP